MNEQHKTVPTDLGWYPPYRLEPAVGAIGYRRWGSLYADMANLRNCIYTNEPGIISPAKENCLKALDMIAPENVKVVILGQDPYPTLGKASGLAFGYHPDYAGPINSSLSNILTEAVRGLPAAEYRADKTLESWAQQGVLLLNTCLTVEEGKPGSHAHLGWQQLIGRVLHKVSDSYNTNLVCMLWGAKARGFRVCLNPQTEGSLLILEASHPCRYSAKRATKDCPAFIGCDHFNKANAWLQANGQFPIEWATKR